MTATGAGWIDLAIIGELSVGTRVFVYEICVMLARYRKKINL